MLCFRLLYAIVLSSDVFDARAHVCVYVAHWHCTAQLSMFNMEMRFRNKIIIIITEAEVDVSKNRERKMKHKLNKFYSCQGRWQRERLKGEN